MPEVIQTEKLYAFLAGNRLSLELFYKAVLCIQRGQADFFEHPIKLPIHDRVTPEEHKRRCDVLKSCMQVGDVLLTFNQSSVMSRLIAHLDRGSWSHTTSVTAVGVVTEAIPGSGVTETSIEKYCHYNYRLGLYRFTTEAPDLPKGLAWSKAQMGKKYNYFGALRQGVAMLRGKHWGHEVNKFPVSYDTNLVCRV